MTVIIYTTPTCVYCKMAKAHLADKRISYQEIDVVLDSSKQQEMIAKSGQLGVPVIDIDGKIIVGFDQQAIDQALGAR